MSIAISDISNKDLLTSILKAIKDESQIIKEEIKREIITENNKILEQLNEHKKKFSYLESQFNSLEQRCMNFERLYRKNNIIIFGLKVNNTDNLLEFTLQKLNELLGIAIVQADINNIFQLKSDRVPPIKVEFVSYLKKDIVLKNCNKLKGTKIFIAQDLPKEDREDQKILYSHLKLARSKQLVAKIRGKTLRINDEIYTLDKLKEIENKENFVENTSKKETELEYSTSNSAPATPTKIKINCPDIFNYEIRNLEDLTSSATKENSAINLKLTPPILEKNKKKFQEDGKPADQKREIEKKGLQRTNSSASEKEEISNRPVRKSRIR